MGEEMIQTGVCAAAATSTGWWNSLKSGAGYESHVITPSPATCSLDTTISPAAGLFGTNWQGMAANDLTAEAKSRSSTIESPGSASNSSVTYMQDCTGAHHQAQILTPDHHQGFSSTVMMGGSNPQLMGFDLSSPDWNRSLVSGNNASVQHEQVGYSAMYQEDMSMKPYLNYVHPSNINGGDNTTSPCLNQVGLMLQAEQTNQLSLPSSLEFPSSVLRSLLAPSVGSVPPHAYGSIGVPSDGAEGPNRWMENSMNANNINAPAYFDKVCSSVRQPLQFSNETPFWSPSGAVSSPSNNMGASVFNGNNALKTAMEGVGQSSSMIKRKTENNSTLKKPRMDHTPSPLPTFKVRKEKLGDRITALQQLVSPFGKTDTASVLHETIEYIKFLHDQVGVLSAPYLKNSHQMQQIKNLDNSKENEGAKRDLITRGLCLVPISSTFAVASDVPVDIWAPVFGANFR